MKLPSAIKDKLCAALGLSLVCGLALPPESVQAKNKKVKPAQAKPAQDTSGTEANKAKPKSADPALEAKQTPKKTEDQCPACGRG